MKRQMHLQERRRMRLFLIGMLGFMGWGIFSLPPGWAQEKGMKVLAREEALRIALEKNKDILKAQEYRNMVMGRYVEERSAALPQFQLSGGYSRDRDDATFIAGVLPHGIFELTAVFLATAAMFNVGARLVTPQTEKSLGEVLLLSLADWFRIFIGIVLPLLAIAAVIEVYVTPLLIKLAFPYL